MTSFRTDGLDHVALVVSDMERSIAWYEGVLAMERRFADVWKGQGDPVVLCNGEACVALFEPDHQAVLQVDRRKQDHARSLRDAAANELFVITASTAGNLQSAAARAADFSPGGTGSR